MSSPPDAGNIAGSAAGTGGAAGGSGATGSGGSAASGATAGSSGMGGAAGSGGTSGVLDPGTEGDGDFEIGPDYEDSPDLAQKDVPHGEVFHFEMSSEDSELFSGMDATLLPQNRHSFTRDIDVYIPDQYVDGTPAPILIVQDGYVGDIVRALDNLIAEPNVERRLPRIVAVFVANGGGDSKGSERGLEYDTLSDRYARFIENEVLPAVKADPEIEAAYPNLAFTNDPEGRGAYGCSSGGAAAFTLGWFSPQWFRRIITYSGTFVDQQDDDAAEEEAYPLGAWEYHERLIEDDEKKPLRVFLQVGEDDNGATNSEASHHNWVLANERMAEKLAAKGNHYRYLFAQGAGHCDGRVRRETLPDTLLWTWRGYPLD
jgi:enterochelin esterase family protein